MKNTDFSEIENALRQLRPAKTPEDLSQKLCRICQIETHQSWQHLLKWIWIPVSVAALLALCLNPNLRQDANTKQISKNDAKPSFIALKNNLLASLDTLNDGVQNTTTARAIHCLRQEAIQSKKIFEENLNVQRKIIQNGAIATEIIFSPTPTYTAIMQTSRIIRQEEGKKPENNRL